MICNLMFFELWKMQQRLSTVGQIHFNKAFNVEIIWFSKFYRFESNQIKSMHCFKIAGICVPEPYAMWILGASFVVNSCLSIFTA